MRKSIRYVGLDVHKETIEVAVADAGRSPAQGWGTIPNNYAALLQCLERLGAKEKLRVCYEAGPTGYELARYLGGLGICCKVVAPSLVPKQSGVRIKTDRRDAARLAHFLRSGDLVEVKVPEAQTEAMRELERAREDAKRAEREARQQLSAFLLRHGRIWPGLTRWTKRHMAWIESQHFAEEALQRTKRYYLSAVEQAGLKVSGLEKDIQELVEHWALKPLVEALQALRGVRLTSAVVLAAEIGDYQRFCRPSQLMAYLGLVPSEHSSGGSRSQGRITRTGNGHVRRILTEAAWAYRYRPRRTKAIQARSQGASQEVQAIAWKAQERLCRRFSRLQARGKQVNQVVTAVARELAGFVWAIAKQTASAG